MRKMLAFMISVTSFVAAAARAGHPVTPFKRVAQPLPANVEHLSGIEARRYLNSLRIKHPGVFERAAADLRRKGFTETDEVHVYRTVQHVRRGVKSMGVRPPFNLADTASNSDGEIVYWYWDDGGDYSTWQGSVYVNDYASGTWITASCQTSVVEGQEWYLIWDAIDGAGGGDIDRTPPQVAWRGDYHRVDFDWDRVVRKWEDWSWCTAAGCAGTTYTCFALGRDPRQKAICAGATCIGIGIGCLYVLR
jgi:hypothetical protein